MNIIKRISYRKKAARRLQIALGNLVVVTLPPPVNNTGGDGNGTGGGTGTGTGTGGGVIQS